MRKFLSLLMMLMFSVGLFAGTETTVYYTAPAATIGTYTVKLNINRQGDADNWAQYTMTKTEFAYNGDPVYTYTYTDLYNGVGAMQFQLYDGATWKSQDVAISQWTSVNTYNGMMYVHATKQWVAAPTSTDPPAKKYYAKYAEEGKEEWSWHAMTEKEGKWQTDTIVYLGGGMNIHESMAGDGKYFESIEGVSSKDTAYFTFNPVDSTLAATVVGKYVAPLVHYYIAGTMNEWKVGAHELVSGNGDTVSLSISLESDSLYEFKVVKVAGTDTTWYGMQETAAMAYGKSTGWWLYKSEGESNQANVGLQTTKAGEYLFIFEANEHNIISVVIPEPAKKYYAKYAEEGKAEWSWHAMTEKDGRWQTDTIVYLGGGMNIHESMAGDGKYFESIEGVSSKDTAYFTFNPVDSTLAATVVGKYVAPLVHYYIAGTMNEWKVGAHELVSGNGDTVSLSISLESDSLYEFKVVKVAGTDTTWYGMQETAAMAYGKSTGWWLYKSEGESNQANVGLQTTKAGEYLFIFEANEHNIISVVIPEPEQYIPTLENGFYLVGEFNSVPKWEVSALDASMKFVKNTEAQDGDEYTISVTLFAGDKFKAIYVENDVRTGWYPDGEGNDYVVDANHAGEKTIYFRPTWNEGWGGHFYVAPNETTAIDNAASNVKAVKMIQNGTLFIKKGNKTYHVMGTLVR